MNSLQSALFALPPDADGYQFDASSEFHQAEPADDPNPWGDRMPAADAAIAQDICDLVDQLNGRTLQAMEDFLTHGGPDPVVEAEKTAALLSGRLQELDALGFETQHDRLRYIRYCLWSVLEEVIASRGESALENSTPAPALQGDRSTGGSSPTMWPPHGVGARSSGKSEPPIGQSPATPRYRSNSSFPPFQRLNTVRRPHLGTGPRVLSYGTPMRDVGGTPVDIRTTPKTGPEILQVTSTSWFLRQHGKKVGAGRIEQRRNSLQINQLCLLGTRAAPLPGNLLDPRFRKDDSGRGAPPAPIRSTSPPPRTQPTRHQPDAFWTQCLNRSVAAPCRGRIESSC